MKAKEVRAGNKLISKFMNSVKEDALMHEFQKSERLPRKDYESSWDWLMPVVEKIAAKYHTVSINYDEGMCQCLITVYDENGAYESAFESIDSNGILAIYEAVIEFIKWYNNQEK